MTSPQQDPFTDTVSSHRTSTAAESFENVHLRPESDPFDADRISPIESRDPGHETQSGALLSDGPPEVQDARKKSAQAQSRARPVKEKALPILRYRKRSLCLLVCYLPFLILPWVLTCILAIRPPSLPSYYNQMGEYGANLYLVILFWMGLIRVFNAIASLMTVPVLSALLAQGAVVYTQRRKLKQTLNLRQTFALADRGWADIPILWGAWRSAGTSSKYLWLAAGLLSLSALQVPVQQALVTTETILIMTCNDNPIWDFSKYCDPLRFPTVLAWDPEPYDLAQTPLNVVVQEVANNIALVSDADVQLNMWHDPSTWSTGNVDDDLDANTNTFEWYFPPSQPGNQTFFVSAIPNNTITGVLREHAMRVNSSVECSSIDPTAFPTTCAGDRPFVTSYSSTNFSIDICVPGDYSVTPWTLSRDRQDIEEEIFVRVYISDSSTFWFDTGVDATNITTHCSAATTRGYFELGNYRNDYTAGPLINQWPDNATMWAEFNDYLNFAGGNLVPQTINNYLEDFTEWRVGADPFDTWALPTPGPLMTSAIAMFGNQSFFYVAANSSNSTFPSAIAQICQSGNIPFARLSLLLFGVEGPLDYCNDINSQYYERVNVGNSTLDAMLYNWFLIFNSTTGGYDDYAVEALSVGMFLASEAWLTQTAYLTSGLTGNARNIYTSPGSPVIRPFKTLAGTIIISTLILLQLVGLTVLAWYIYTVPTWTAGLDSLAVARLARTIAEDELPPIGSVGKKDLEKLSKVDGLVGVVEDESAVTVVETAATDDQTVDRAKDHLVAVEPVRSASPKLAASSGVSLKLARGAKGLITKRHAPPKKKRRWMRKAKTSQEGDTHEMQQLNMGEV